jgi:RHS repeat-associated protein
MRTPSLGSRKGIGRSSLPVRCLTESLLGSRFVTYKINAMGQRVQKIGAGLYAPSTTATINTTTGQSPQGISLNFNARFAYDEQGRIIGEYANDGKLIAETIWFNDLPIATLRPKGSNNQIPLGTPGTTATQANNVGNNMTANKVNVDIYYVHPDHLGTPRVVTRSAAIGSVTTGPNAINKQVWRANTDPFGTALGNSAPNENPQLVTGTATQIQAATFRLNHRFPGQSFDAESGKSDNWHRIYDSTGGRYTQSDPIGLLGGLNPYGYVGQNSITQSYRSGLQGSDYFVPIPYYSWFKGRSWCYQPIASSTFNDLQGAPGGWSTISDNTPFNAVLHCWGVCRLQRDCGGVQRYIVATGHEYWNNGDVPLLTNFPASWNDLFNNEIGVRCASRRQCGDSKGDCYKCCMQMLQDGWLRFKPTSPYWRN